MSQLSDQLRLPPGWAVPDELEQAWAWIDDQGWTISNQNGLFSTPYPGDSQLGVVFTSTATLDGWFTESTPGFDQLVPIAEIAGDGSIGALWRDDSGEIRVVGLGSEGESYLLAESVVDFLQLAAIGYTELTPIDLGVEPDDEEAVEAHAPFRAWVSNTFGVEVPTDWNEVGEDEFTDWVAAKLGLESAPRTPPPPPASGGAQEVQGAVRLVLDALGDGRAGEATLALVQAAGITPDPQKWAAGGIGRQTRALTKAGLEVIVERKVVETIFIHTEPGGTSLTAPDSLIAGLDAVGSRESVAALLGRWSCPGTPTTGMSSRDASCTSPSAPMGWSC